MLTLTNSSLTHLSSPASPLSLTQASRLQMHSPSRIHKTKTRTCLTKGAGKPPPKTEEDNHRRVTTRLILWRHGTHLGNCLPPGVVDTEPLAKIAELLTIIIVHHRLSNNSVKIIREILVAICVVQFSKDQSSPRCAALVQIQGVPFTLKSSPAWRQPAVEL